MCFGALFILLLLLARTAFAQDANYQNFITGGRSVGFGGAFTAFGNDPTGILFNPAGLVEATRVMGASAAITT